MLKLKNLFVFVLCAVFSATLCLPNFVYANQAYTINSSENSFTDTQKETDRFPNDSQLKKYNADFKYLKENKKINIDFKYADSLFNNSNKEYNKNLAELSTLLSTIAYSPCKIKDSAMGGSYVKIKNSTQYRSNDDIQGLVKTLGFSDVYYHDMDPNDYKTLNYTGKNIDLPDLSKDYFKTDKSDTTAYFISSKKTTIDGKEANILLLAFRGTNGTWNEWSSNFEVGADTQEYYNLAGSEHPDWKHKENHKGLDVASTRALIGIKSYISEVLDTDIPTYVLNTGHSRGGGISNLVGKELETDSFFTSQNFIPYTYTFAAPSSTTDPKHAEYKSIFNIINDDDLVPKIPTEKMGFYKYGNNLTASAKCSLNKSCQQENGLGKLPYNAPSKEIVNNVILNMEKAINGGREDFYKFKKTYDFKNTSALSQNGEDQNVADHLLRWTRVLSSNSKGKVLELTPAFECEFLACLASKGAGFGFKNGIVAELDGPYHFVSKSFIQWSGKLNFDILNILGGYSGDGEGEVPHYMCYYFALVHNYL